MGILRARYSKAANGPASAKMSAARHSTSTPLLPSTPPTAWLSSAHRPLLAMVRSFGHFDPREKLSRWWGCVFLASMDEHFPTLAAPAPLKMECFALRTPANG